MNGSLIDDLMGQLQGGSMGQIAQQLGTDTATASQAVGAALPMLVGAMGRNAQQPGGAEALFGALAGGGQGAGGAGAALGGLGGLGGLLGGLLGDGGGTPASAQMDGGGILGHVFGDAQGRAQSGLGQATGLNGSQAGSLLAMLAPMVMAALSQRVSADNLNAGGLGSMLGQEHAQVQQQGGLGGGLLGAVLDQNGDGKFDLSDVLKLGGSLLGGRR